MTDEEWKRLAAKNPQRVTYPSWRPKEYWEAQARKAPWVTGAGTKDWRKADTHRADAVARIRGWKNRG